jgi:microcystin-dependent protein
MTSQTFIMKIIALSILVLISTFSEQLVASDLFTYQGKLTDASGDALADGQYRIGVRIWENSTPPAQNPENEEPLWARKYDVPVQDGLFSLMIGATGIAWTHTPGALTDSLKLALSGGNRFLDITIMSDANGSVRDQAQWQTLAPRQSLNAVPYAMNGVPTGTVVPFAGTIAPEGWLICNGATTLPIDDPRYRQLQAVIGTVFNTGDEPSGHFRIPDMRGRTAIGSGQGNTRAHEDVQPATNWLLGTRFGTERHKITKSEMPNHKHGYHDPGHTHNWGPAQRTPVQYDAGGNRSAYDWWNGNYNEVTSRSFTGINFIAEGGDQPHNNMQPSLVLNYIIKL